MRRKNNMIIGYLWPLFIAQLLLGCSNSMVSFEHSNTFAETITHIDGIGEYQGCSSQGLAIYDKYAFITYETGYIRVLDCVSKTVIGSYEMPAGVHHKNNHAGMANFGMHFYNDDDTIPLLYISSYQESKCYVLRVSFSDSELIQEIQMDGAWHFFVDDEDNLIVRLSNNTYYIFDLPPINQRNVVLDKSEAKMAFTFDIPNMSYAGALCYRGRMYVLCYYNEVPFGVDGKYDRLIEFDYYKNEIVSQIVFKDPRIRTIEFEGLSLASNGSLVISFVYDQIATIPFAFQ